MPGFKPKALRTATGRTIWPLVDINTALMGSSWSSTKWVFYLPFDLGNYSVFSSANRCLAVLGAGGQPWREASGFSIQVIGLHGDGGAAVLGQGGGVIDRHRRADQAHVTDVDLAAQLGGGQAKTDQVKPLGLSRINFATSALKLNTGVSSGKAGPPFCTLIAVDRFLLCTQTPSLPTK